MPPPGLRGGLRATTGYTREKGRPPMDKGERFKPLHEYHYDTF